MSYDLVGHGGARIDEDSWIKAFDIAVAFGWEPAGTLAPSDCDYGDQWNGTYFGPGGQEVTHDDARAFGLALHRAITALRTGESLTGEQAKVCHRVNLVAISELADYAISGGFLMY
jgi:hypothetical protein